MFFKNNMIIYVLFDIYSYCGLLKKEVESFKGKGYIKEYPVFVLF